MSTTTQTPTIDEARARLADVDRDLQAIDARIDATNRALGDALAAMRAGDKRAERRAGELSLTRAELERRRQELLLERAAVEAQLVEMEEVEAAASRERAFHHFDELTDRARELETTLAEQIQAAAATARELRSIHTPWVHAQREIALMGMDSTIADVDAPRNPNWLFNLRVINDAAEAVANWLKPAWRYPTGKPRLSIAPDAPKRKPIFVSTEDHILRALREKRESENQDGAA